MKKKIVFVLFAFLALAFIGFKYVYKEHRNIELETALLSISVKEIYVDFKRNDSIANIKYSDKTIEVQGTITNIDPINKIITLDDKLLVRFTNSLDKSVKIQNLITVKGRLIGYDDILEEIQMDQCTITNNE